MNDNLTTFENLWNKWKILAKEDFYWFCLRRNFEYRRDIDYFKSELGLFIEHYVEPYNRTNSSNILVRGRTEGVPVLLNHSQPATVFYSKYDIENINLLNESYLAFLGKWKIEPFYYNQTVETPKIIPAPKKFRSTTVIDIPGEFTVFGSLADSQTHLKTKLENEISLARSKSRQINDLAYKAQSSNFNEIQLSLFVFSIWENHQGSELYICSQWDCEKSLPATGWPKGFSKFFSKITPARSSDIYSSLRKDLDRAYSYIVNPHHIMRSL